MEMFEKALKNKLRFEGSGQGVLSTEDLFDLSLPTLDKMAKGVNKLLRDEGEDSFIPSATPKRATNNDLPYYLVLSPLTEHPWAGHY